jgi:tubulin polyglutamylase TTLL6/13
MYKVFPEEYNFFPKTWVLPSESTDLRSHWIRNLNNSKKSKITYIVKPDGLSQGRGIFLSRNIEHIFDCTMGVKNEGEVCPMDTDRIGYVVQQYIDRPHLVEDLKYDLRIYVMLYGVNPLRIYLHKMAFARFCTETY